MKRSSNDLTKGSILKQILVVALPILAGQILQSTYNSVDSLVVGNYVGKTALAAVTSCNDISRLIIGFFTGLSTGAGILFSNYYGAGNYSRLRTAIHTSLLFACFLGAIMAVAGVCLSPVLLNMVHCPPDVYYEALLYLRVYFIGALLTSIYNMAAGALRAVGDTKNPLYYLVFSSCTNVILDMVFVRMFGMGVLGVAFATILSQAASVLLILFNMVQSEDVYRIELSLLRPDWEILKEVLQLGLPAGMQTCLVTFSNLFVQRYVNEFGSSAMAGVGAAKKIDKYVTLNMETFGMTGAIFIAQNEGAGNRKRAYEGILYILVMEIMIISIMGTFCVHHAERLMLIFTKDKEAVDTGTLMLRIFFKVYALQMLHNTMVYTIRGFGKSQKAMLISLFGIVLCRQIFLAIMMPLKNDIRYVFYAYPAGWICALCLSIPYFYFGIVRKKWNNTKARTGI